MAKTAELGEAQPIRHTLGGMFLVALGLLLGIFIHTFLTSATPAFLSFGAVWALMIAFCFAIFALPALLIVHLVLWLIWRKRGLPSWLNNRNLIRLALAGFVLGIAAGLYGAIPNVRYREHAGIASNEVSEVKVEGFDSLLARRWLFSFKVTPQGRDEIVSGLNLQLRDKLNPAGSPADDMFFKNAMVPWLASIPRPEDSQTFDRRTDINDSSVAWITFAYDPETGNAWLYKGYQN